jgi:uncharacterized membrane protein
MNHTPATAAAARNAYIDLLRGAAILCVLILHFSLRAYSRWKGEVDGDDW